MEMEEAPVGSGLRNWGVCYQGWNKSEGPNAWELHLPAEANNHHRYVEAESLGCLNKVNKNQNLVVLIKR